MTVLRQGMTGEVGFELQYPAEHAERVWAELLRIGEEFGIRQLGGRVAMINHLEAYYPTQGLDYLPAIFRGAAALREELASPRRIGATLVWNADDVVDVYASLFRKGEPLPDYMEIPQEPRGFVFADSILKNGEPVGVTSSRGYSAYFREMISLAVIDVEHHRIGDELTVVWGNPGTSQREIRATIAPAPYKVDRARIDLHTL